jgi:CRISPR-associated endonuclease/helicase Cas3
MPLLAHSARPTKGIPEQLYCEHVRAVARRAHASALAVARFRDDAGFPAFIRLAACWHDLGKVDPENQSVLRSGKRDALPVEHEYAGVCYLRERQRGLAATLVYSHHRGLPNFLEHLSEDVPFEDFKDIALKRVEKLLKQLVAEHLAAVPELEEPIPAQRGWRVEAKQRSGLAWRFALSCLIDGDHFDTAQHYGKEWEIEPLKGRWNERVQALDRYVRELSRNSKATRERNRLREAVYEGCCNLDASQKRYACDSGVGTGKTTAVMAHLLRVARDRNLRHIFVVLPYTNIINQSVETYRKALVLAGEDAERVVAAHHHQVDFESAELRQLATLWDCPITVTTAVQFFQTMAASRPGPLRKFHELAGSAVFIDEAHAALPAWLWPQTWLWIDELTREWECHFVFASGSLVRFWEHQDFVQPPAIVPEILTDSVRHGTESGERTRVRYQRENCRLGFDELIGRVFGKRNAGPHLIVVNTVQTAAELARAMRNAGHDVLHLSTALAPQDREPIVERIKARVTDETDTNWALVATSCVEAGLDFDFRTAFRELSSVTSVIQIGGRVNRHAKGESATVWVFSLDDARASQNPALKISMAVLERLFASGDMERLSASEVCTKALRMELNEASQTKLGVIRDLEHKKNFPDVAHEYRVIEDETVIVLVDPTRSAFESGNKVTAAEIVRGSVRVRKSLEKKYALRPLDGKDELFAWTLDYDPDFLGYMDGVLRTKSVIAGEFTSA